MRRSTLQEQAARLRALLKTSDDPLGVFTRAFFPVIEPGGQWRESVGTRAVARFAWRWATGRGNTRAVGNAPPGCGKSTIVEVMLPCLYWGLVDDSTWWLTIAYEASLAQRFNALRVQVMRSELFALTFPHVYVHKDNLGAVENRNGGAMHAASIGQPVIGKHYDFQIFGDLLNPTQVHAANASESQTALVKAWNFVQEATTRVGAYQTLSQLVFAQRIHMYDPSGQFLTTFTDADRLRLPLFYDPEQPDPFDTRTEKEEKLWAISDTEVAKQRRLLGNERFEAQYQQNPQHSGASVWKPDWNVHRYLELPRLVQLGRAFVVQSWDGGLKGKKETHSRLAGTLWAKVDGKAYLLCMGTPGAVDFVTALDFIHGQQKLPLWSQAKAILIENQASGPGMISTIQADLVKYPWGRWVSGYDTGTASKLQRMDPWLPHARSGDVVLPDPERYPWVRDWEKEITGFPNYLFDDFWDSTSQALAHIFGGGAISWKDAWEAMKGNRS